MANDAGPISAGGVNTAGPIHYVATGEEGGDTGYEGFTEAEWWTRRHKLNRTDNRRRQRDPIRTNRNDDE